MEENSMPSVRRTETPLAQLYFQPWKFISEAARGSQFLTTRQVSDGCHHVRPVRRAATNSHRCMSMQSL